MGRLVNWQQLPSELGKRLICGDSMVAPLKDSEVLEFRSFGGYGIFQMTDKLLHQNVIRLGEYGVLVVHMGTCDVWKYKAAAWVAQVADLVQGLRARHPSLSVVLSAILPRPRDFRRSDEVVKGFNNKLRKWARGHGVPFLETQRPFFTGTWDVRRELFQDGLHLRKHGSPDRNGAAVLQNFFKTYVEDDGQLRRLLRHAEGQGRFRFNGKLRK